MDIPNVRPGALSGTMQKFGADPLTDEYVETAQQPEGPELVDLPSVTQVASPDGIDSTTEVGDNPVSESPADQPVTGDPQNTPEAVSVADSPPTGDTAADDTDQNSTSSDSS